MTRKSIQKVLRYVPRASRVLVTHLVIIALLGTSVLPVCAQPAIILPPVGTLIDPSAALIPAIIRGITVYPENPLQFNFLVDTGDINVPEAQLNDQTIEMVKYFLTALTVPEEELWVNLSPYEKDRIIPQALGTTRMGQALLAQDYLLKQLTASLIYPEKEIGEAFWQRVYAKAREKYGTIDIPVNTFNKVWIVPDHATVYEHDNTATIVESKLKVMLEADYIALQENLGVSTFGLDSAPETAADVTTIGADIIREIIIPEIEKEVNTGTHFALLRQIYHAMILATWFKGKLKNSLLSAVYVDQQKINGLEGDDPAAIKNIYNQYVETFSKGVYNYIREEYDPVSQDIIPRKYFSGGFNFKTSESTTTINDTRSIPEKFRAYVRTTSQRFKNIGINLFENSNQTDIEKAQTPTAQNTRTPRAVARSKFNPKSVILPLVGALLAASMVTQKPAAAEDQMFIQNATAYTTALADKSERPQNIQETPKDLYNGFFSIFINLQHNNATNNDTKQFIIFFEKLAENQDQEINWNAQETGTQMTTLAYAAKNGADKIIQALLERGADPTISDAEGKLPIDYAQAKLHKDFAGVNYEGQIPASADLSRELYRELTRAVDLLQNAMKQRAQLKKLNTTPLQSAAATGDMYVMNELLKKNLDNTTDINMPNMSDNEKNALHYAIENNNAAVVKTLIEHGADIQMPMIIRDWTDLPFLSLIGVKELPRISPVELALNSQATTALDAMLESGRILINDRDINGATLLMKAATRGDALMVNWLLSRGANPHVRSDDGMTALDYANDFYNNSPYTHRLAAAQCIDDLKKAMPENDLTYQNSITKSRLPASPVTELYTAAAQKDISEDARAEAIATVLNSRLITINATDKNGFTALHLATAEGNYAAMKALLALGADATIGAKGYSGMFDTPLIEDQMIVFTPMMLAIKNSDLTAAKILVNDGGISINKADENGNLPIEYALTPNFIEKRNGVEQEILAEKLLPTSELTEDKKALSPAIEAIHENIHAYEALSEISIIEKAIETTSDPLTLYALDTVAHEPDFETVKKSNDKISFIEGYKQSLGRFDMTSLENFWEILTSVKDVVRKRIEELGKDETFFENHTNAVLPRKDENETDEPDATKTPTDKKLAQKNTDSYGGINLNPAALKLEIKRDDSGVPLPMSEQPIATMAIEGFYPVIINVSPATDLPLLLGLNDAENTAVNG